jgi:hypothetical protein
LRVVENICHRVHALVEIRKENSHCLLTHSRLIGITRRLQ